MKIGFDQSRYLKLQTAQILERVNSKGRLYLEVGGKLADDYHAARVLPGFDPRSKLEVLKRLSDKVEVIVCVSATSLTQNKMRADFGIGYGDETIRLVQTLRQENLTVDNVVITLFDEQKMALDFKTKLERQLGIAVHLHRRTAGYPTDIDMIVSDQGYGQNSYIEVQKPIVVITAPGPASGKLATSLSQVYHETKLGQSAIYAKYETFPVWDLSLKHPVNVAYEAATVDLGDNILIDPFHLEAYGVAAVNYNRDVDTFPVLKRIMDKITGQELTYRSPTDMSINVITQAITDDKVVREAAKQEIVRRYLKTRNDFEQGKATEDALERSILLMEELGLSVNDRATYVAAHRRLAKLSPYPGASVVAIELDNGKIVCGRSSKELSALSAAMLNALKSLARINDTIHLLAPETLTPIRDFKRNQLQLKSEAMELDEILLALNISAVTNPIAKTAISKIERLRGCRAHSTAILSHRDEETCRELGIDITSENFLVI